MKRRSFLQLGTASLALTACHSLPTALQMPISAKPLMAVPDDLKNNPLLQFETLPNYQAITPAHIEPAIKFIMETSRQKIEELIKQDNPTWASLYQPLEELYALRYYSFSIASDLNSLANTKEIRTAYDAARKHRSEFNNWYNTNDQIYQAFKRLKQSGEYSRYTDAQKRALDKELSDFERAGVGLPSDKKERLTQISDRLSKLRTQFSNNTLDSSKWSMTLSEQEVSGIPESELSLAKEDAKKDGTDGYKFTLNDATIRTVLEYADNRTFREKFYKAYVTRASKQADDGGKYDNSPVIEEILALQYERAKLLGYDNYAQYALADRMAKTPKEVMDFYQGLLAKTAPVAKAQTADLIAYGKQKLGIDNPQAWDMHYITNKKKQAEYDFDQELLRPYFPMDKVLSGVFEVNRRLFGITVKERFDVKGWHPSVRFFDIFDDRGQHLGSTYADLYTREGKRSGAWKSNVILKRKTANGKIIKPVTMLVANITPPTDGVALLTQNDMIAVLHEFGHCLHQIISTVDITNITGTAIARDAVEFPSQLMEYWAWHKDSISLFSGHYKTGEALPQSLIDKAAAAKDYMMARYTMNQIDYGLGDIRLYNEYNPNEKGFVERIVKEVADVTTSLVKRPDYDRSLNTFNHIFTSSTYAAGYYGYVWSDVLSADVFAHFEQVGIFNRAEGKRYVEKFLSLGNSKEVMAMYVDFMGRKPKPDAFMKQIQS